MNRRGICGSRHRWSRIAMPELKHSVRKRSPIDLSQSFARTLAQGVFARIDSTKIGEFHSSSSHAKIQTVGLQSDWPCNPDSTLKGTADGTRRYCCAIQERTKQRIQTPLSPAASRSR